MIINFRTKFAKLIMNEAQYHEFLDAFEKFVDLHDKKAFDILWRLTYVNSSEALSAIGLTNVPLEMLTILRNELRYQYEQHHPNIFDVEIPENCKEAFSALEKRTDSFTAKVVYKHCCMHTFVARKEQERIIFLLNHSDENYRFGGIRSISFNSAEATYLLPHHELIHDLFTTTLEYQNREVFQKIKPVRPESSVSIAVSPTFKELSPENILADNVHFAVFALEKNMDTLLHIKEIGYDLNKVITKKEEIATFLKAAFALNNQ